MSTVNDFYGQRPGLAYQHAFDWLAVQLQGIEGSYAGLVPSVFQGVELRRRLPEMPFMDPVPLGLVKASLDIGLNHVVLFDGTEKLAAIAWVEPRQSDAVMLEQIRQQLAVNGRLFLIVGGRLAALLTEQRQQDDVLWSATAAKAQLQAGGFSVTAQFGLHGVQAILWHYLGLAAGKSGQPHWQDRCHYAMRRAFVEPGRGQSVSALICLAAERRI